MPLFNASTCDLQYETLGQRLTTMVEDIRVHNKSSNIPKLTFKTIGRVTVLFRTEARVGVSIMEYADSENKQIFDLAIYGYKTPREVYEELRRTEKIEEATEFLQFHRDWDLVYKLIEIVR